MKSFNSKFKIIKSLVVIVIYYFSLLIFNLGAVGAASMESSRYKIKSEKVNIGADSIASSEAQLAATLGSQAADEFNRSGYIIKASSPSLNSIIPFTFSISNTTINFGMLQPNTPLINSNIKLTVELGGNGQYSVAAAQTTPLQTLAGDNRVDDTSCDGGNNSCTIKYAKKWQSNTAYGFGYNLLGDDIPSDFIANYYRPFVDMSSDNQPIEIMGGININKYVFNSDRNTKQATLTLKVNVSPIQAGGNYQTIISFVAIPSY